MAAFFENNEYLIPLNAVAMVEKRFGGAQLSIRLYNVSADIELNLPADIAAFDSAFRAFLNPTAPAPSPV